LRDLVRLYAPANIAVTQYVTLRIVMAAHTYGTFVNFAKIKCGIIRRFAVYMAEEVLFWFVLIVGFRFMKKI
jgi:hypothetical protein